MHFDFRWHNILVLTHDCINHFNSSFSKSYVDYPNVVVNFEKHLQLKIKITSSLSVIVSTFGNSAIKEVVEGSIMVTRKHNKKCSHLNVRLK